MSFKDPASLPLICLNVYVVSQNKQTEFTFNTPVRLACSYISLISDFKYETVQVKKANKVSDEVMEKEKEEDKSEK